MGIGTTAEGVETEEQFAIVKAAGCDEAQGYLFSPPRPSREITEMLLGDVTPAVTDGHDSRLDTAILLQ
jgi:EAL domain-containing protein (putative c-di-GMP-specific phosphodiesterase class I)